MAADRGLLGAVRGLPRLGRVALLAIFMALEALFFYFLLRRSDFDVYPAYRMAATLSIYGGFAIVLGWVALRPLYQPPPRESFVSALLGVALLLPIVAALLPEVPSTLQFTPKAVYSYYCFVVGGGVAMGIILLARALDRTGLSIPASALAVAVAGGLVGAIAVHIECPNNQWLHLLLGHATIPVGMVLGTWLFRRTGS